MLNQAFGFIRGLFGGGMMVDLRTIGEAYTKQNEACRLDAYQDTTGVWTIGWGQTGPNICEGTVWTQQQADQTFDNRWTVAMGDAENCVSTATWTAMGAARQAVLVDMAYQLGFRGLQGFHQMRMLLEAQNWGGAAADALQSLAAKQTPNRWARHAKILRAGNTAIVYGLLHPEDLTNV